MSAAAAAEQAGQMKNLKISEKSIAIHPLLKPPSQHTLNCLPVEGALVVVIVVPNPPPKPELAAAGCPNENPTANITKIVPMNKHKLTSSRPTLLMTASMTTVSTNL